MNNFNGIVKVGLFFLLLVKVSIANARIILGEFAGPDITILIDCPDAAAWEFDVQGDDNSPENILMVQYSWSLVDFNPKFYETPPEVEYEGTLGSHTPSPHIVVHKPYGGFYQVTFQVSRQSYYGSEVDFMTVTFTDRVFVKATPLKGCWNEGERIEIQQFKIETAPSGFDDLVDVSSSTNRANIPFGFADATSEMTVLFTYDGELIDDCDATITVVDSGQGMELDFISGNKNLVRVVKILSSIEDYGEKFQKVKDMIDAKCPKIFKSKFQADWNFGGSFNFGLHEMCCNERSVEYCTLGGQLFLSGNIMAHFPIQSWLNFDGGLEGGINLNLAGMSVSSQNGCGEVSLNFGYGFSVVGGLTAYLADPDLMSVSAALRGGLNGNVSIISSSGVKWDPSYDMYLRAEVSYVLVITRGQWVWTIY